MVDNAGKIAVVIPVYNVSSFLQEAIQSAVDQDYPQKEIIVVNDGSSPERAEDIERICKRFPDIILLHQPHAGAAAARNKGVKHTSAELILFLDADDLLLPGALSYLAKALQDNPDAIASYARSVVIDAQGHILNGNVRPPEEYMRSGHEVLCMLLERKAFLINGTICMRKDALNKIPPIHHGIKYNEDWVLLCHLALSGNIIPAGDQVIHHRRRHTENISLSPVDRDDLYFSERVKVFQSVYLNPAFFSVYGEDKLRALFEKRMGIIHFKLAKHYMSLADPQKALFHFKSIPQSLPSLSELPDLPEMPGNSKH
jgi:glycosyltransferase involved in cell wall biosynthesis